MDIDETPELLLDRARFMRVEAARARELVQSETRQEVRDGLMTLAAYWLERAWELERRALNIPASRDARVTAASESACSALELAR